MTTIDDLPLAVQATTIESTPPPELPEVEDAKIFYLRSRHLSRTSRALDHLSNALAKELRRLIALPVGWDGEHARPITPQALYGALRVLAAVLNEESEPPQFFPLPDGGIQMAWYAHDQAEIEIDRAGEAYAVTTNTTGEVIEGELDPLARPSELVSHLQTLIKGISIQLDEDRLLT